MVPTARWLGCNARDMLVLSLLHLLVYMMPPVGRLSQQTRWSGGGMRGELGNIQLLDPVEQGVETRA